MNTDYFVGNVHNGPNLKRKLSVVENNNNQNIENNTNQYQNILFCSNDPDFFVDQYPSPEELEFIDQVEASIQHNRKAFISNSQHIHLLPNSNTTTNELGMDSNKDWFNCGLPPTVQTLYQRRGINSQYFWQRECLSSQNVMAVRCYPTFLLMNFAGKKSSNFVANFRRENSCCRNDNFALCSCPKEKSHHGSALR